MAKPDFDKIIHEKCIPESNYVVIFNLSELKKCMKEAWNLAIDRCVETAKIDWAEDDDCYEIDIESILKNKIK